MREPPRFARDTYTGFPSPHPHGAFSSRLQELTKREIEIIHWLTEGKRDREIACIIGVSLRTVQNHVHHILHKLCVETRTAAARMALVQKAPVAAVPAKL